MKFLFLAGLLLCVACGTVAARDDDLYESSGNGVPSSDSFIDDEDSDFEGSGDNNDATTENEADGTYVFTDNPKTTRSTTTKGVSEVSGRTITPAIKEPVKVVDPDPADDKETIAVELSGTPTVQFLVAIIVGGCIGLLFAVCVIMLLVYRMRKKDEGSYALDYGLDKKPQGNYEYTKGVDSKDREYFA